MFGRRSHRVSSVPVNADPLKLDGASFEAQNGKRVRPSASSLVPRATCGSCQYITVLVAVTTSFFPFLPLLRPTPSHHDGLFRVRVSYLLLARSISLSPSSLSLAFTLADPHSWAAPSPLDSPDPIGVLDSILYPPFEREIVSWLFLPRPSLTRPSVFQFYLLRAQHPRPPRAPCPL